MSEYGRGRSRADIATQLGVAPSTVGYWLHRLKIPMRNAIEARQTIFERRRPSELFDSAWLHARIHHDHMSMGAIADLLGVTSSSVRHAADRLGVDTIGDVLADRQLMADLIADHGVVGVAEMLGRSASTIYRRLKAHGLRSDGTDLRARR